MIKKAWAVWRGSLKDGGGSISTETGVLNEAPYGFKARCEDGRGTNPEELIGAAHAGCFSMALSLMLGEAGLTAESDGCLAYRLRLQPWTRESSRLDGEIDEGRTPFGSLAHRAAAVVVRRAPEKTAWDMKRPYLAA